MFQKAASQCVSTGVWYRRSRSVMLWLAVSLGLAVSIFSLIDEMCMATACSDAASFTFFGVGMGVFGIVYFSLILLLLWLRQKVCLLNVAVAALVFSGIGAEFRLIWIQKYIIGSWCPLCVSICCALFVAAILLVIERFIDAECGQEKAKSNFAWLAFVTAMMAIGLAISIVGVQALS